MREGGGAGNWRDLPRTCTSSPGLAPPGSAWMSLGSARWRMETETEGRSKPGRAQPSDLLPSTQSCWSLGRGNVDGCWESTLSFLLSPLTPSPRAVFTPNSTPFGVSCNHTHPGKGSQVVIRTPAAPTPGPGAMRSGLQPGRSYHPKGRGLTRHKAC